MTEPRLSLVIPVYNVDAYLSRCLESLVLLQPAADEIIVVDDGSTDQCPHILSAYAARLPQMRVIRQANGGLSAARNTGLAVARGRWLAFLDSDDFLAPDAYAAALNLAERDDLDMVLLNGHYHFEGRQPDTAIYPEVAATAIISGRDWLRQRLRDDRLAHMVWLHVYRRDFIERHGFKFVPGLVHEDVIWTTQALLAAQRVRFHPPHAISYRIPVRRYSDEQQQRRLTAIIDSSIFNARTLAEIAESLGDDDELRHLLSRQLVDGALSIFHKLEKLPDQSAAKSKRLELRRTGLLSLLWRHAAGPTQHRRLARQWLRSLFAGWPK